MLTIFACPKAFTGHFAIIQRNAITSWSRLEPRPEIILFGDESGIAEICQELGLKHIRDVARSDAGVPLLNDVIAKAQQCASYDILAYVNADIILMADFASAVEKTSQWSDHFLLSGSRWDIWVKECLNFQTGWQNLLRAEVGKFGILQFSGNDYFVFPRQMYQDIPALAIGRFGFDSWLFAKANQLMARIVDGTPAVMVVHQRHDHSHIGITDPSKLWELADVKQNYQLLGLRRTWLLLESTHQLTPVGFIRLWRPARKAMVRLTENAIPLFAKIGIRHSRIGKLARLVSSKLGLNY